MKFLSITGPREDIDRVADTYLSRYEIHLENALSELKTVKNLRPYIEVNPYRDQLAMARSLMQRFGGQLPEVKRSGEETLPDIQEASAFVERLSEELKELTDRREELLIQIEALKKSKDRVAPFTELNYSLREILGFKFIKFRFGRVTREYYDKINNYVYDTIDTLSLIHI